MEAWRKSSYSNANGGDCIEVADSWRKSSFSGATGGSCIELARAPDRIGVRDTKQAHLGDARTILSFTPGAWRVFTEKIK
jgi:hypothetical protein